MGNSLGWTVGEDSQNDDEKPSLSRRQREKVRRYFEDDRRLKAALAGSLSTKKRSPRARALARGDLAVTQRSILDLFSHLPPSTREKLRAKLCEEFEFCKQKRDFNIAFAIIPVLIVAVGPTAITIPLAVWVVLIKNRSMDLLCQCSPMNFDNFVRKVVARLWNRIGPE